MPVNDIDGILSIDLPLRRARAVDTSLPPPTVGAVCTRAAVGFGGGGGGAASTGACFGILGALHICKPTFNLFV